MGDVAADVVFDFDGALRMARDLWSLAASLSTMMTNRESAATYASLDWVGPHQTDFASRMTTERANVDQAVTQLQNAANGWAYQWQQAMDQQNQVLMAREWDGREGDWLNRHSFGIFGSGPERPPDPTPAGLPTAPDFAPTRGFYTASNP